MADDTSTQAVPWWTRPLTLPVWALALIAAAGIGIGAAGAGGSKTNGGGDSDRIATLEQENDDLRDQIGGFESQEGDSEREAREAAERAAAEQAAQEQAALDAFLAAQEKNRIDVGGIYEVGRDINPGRWRTDGPTFSGDFCYYAILSSLDGSIDAIRTNNNIEGPGVIDVPAGTFFEVSGSCSWTNG